jgi:hypothetical protein
MLSTEPDAVPRTMSAMPSFAALPITGDPEADELNVRDPLALLTGMLLDQHIQSTSSALG